MNAEIIKGLMQNGRIYHDIPQGEAEENLRKQISGMYILNGLHRQIPTEAYKQEVAVAARAMYSELMTDPIYKEIRDTEIPYIFSEGMKGRLGTDKDIVITYKSLLRWIEGYLKHEERQLAKKAVIEARYTEPARQIEKTRSYTDEDIVKRIDEAFNQYVLWKQLKMQRKDGPQPVGVLAVPYLVRDLGGRMMEYLVRKGYAQEGETFEEVLEKASKNAEQFVQLLKNKQ